jgi:hypothetical protein
MHKNLLILGRHVLSGVQPRQIGLIHPDSVYSTCASPFHTTDQTSSR